MILTILTNDIHQKVFVFSPKFYQWNDVYSYGWLFYVINLWQYGLYASAILILVLKCRIVSSKKVAWLILIPFAVGIVMSILLMLGKMPKLNGAHIAEFPETIIFMVAIVTDICMQTGLIPTNTHYGKLFKHFSIAAQITDKKGAPVYTSNTALPLTYKQFETGDGSRIGEHILLHKTETPGGYGFWQDDMRELDDLNKQLQDIKEKLSQEAELNRMRNKLKERRIKTEQRTLLYNEIAGRTKRQSHRISALSSKALRSSDSTEKKEILNRIVFLSGYIKRFANLMLLSRDNKFIALGELGLSLSEVLKNLNYCGIPSECIFDTNTTVSAEVALTAFEVFEILLEKNISDLKGVFIKLSEGNSAKFKMNFENMRVTLSNKDKEKLQNTGIKHSMKVENDITYLTFDLPKGGKNI
ncbi:MAG: hypothetical protein IJS61_05895 [Firmicutes bacterium]|nr:hypothetical protein [Bacillota bacterium]